jgi:N-acetylneuraminate lyase
VDLSILEKAQGVVAALVTPLTRTDEIHHESLRRIVGHALRLGVGGFYVCGSTGEGFSLSAEERMRIVETVVREARGSADVIVNLSHMDFRQVVRLSYHAAEVGADAVSVLPPIYNPVSAQELLAYFRAVLLHARLPLTVYNIPQLAHRSLDEATVQELAADTRFVGIKHSSEDTVALARFKQVSDGRLIVWSGRDAYYLSCLAMGADGAIGSSFQLLGDIFVAITQAFRSGDLPRALDLQQRVNEVHAKLQVHGAVKSIKRCLTLLGIDAGECRLPFQALDAGVDEFFREVLADADRVRHDFGIALPSALA